MSVNMRYNQKKKQNTLILQIDQALQNAFITEQLNFLLFCDTVLFYLVCLFIKTLLYFIFYFLFHTWNCSVLWIVRKLWKLSFYNMCLPCVAAIKANNAKKYLIEVANILVLCMICYFTLNNGVSRNSIFLLLR